jgi:hypothetical protein
MPAGFFSPGTVQPVPIIDSDGHVVGYAFIGYAAQQARASVGPPGPLTQAAQAAAAQAAAAQATIDQSGQPLGALAYDAAATDP